MSDPFDFNNNGESDLLDFLIATELDPNNPLNVTKDDYEDDTEVGYEENEYSGLEYEIEDDTGPDDSMETYQYYYDDDEPVDFDPYEDNGSTADIFDMGESDYENWLDDLND